ncbi:BON domain-containing protein [Phenylobacterium sp.]|uniref:BON domain-containing protein n=1 Tax=Phenylobacterium sp. TaxID=1871053 RepID=UPI0028128C6D|nr:BON domain-containing protein [Phenylobacterium sp.]
MPDRWMEERERRMRERNWRNEAYGRGGGDEPRQGRLWQENRSFDDEGRGGYGRYEGAEGTSRDRYAARFEGHDRDRVFGERDTGAEYNRSNVRTGGGAYGAGGSYGGGQSYGQGAGAGRDWQGGGQDYRSRSFGGGRDERPEWQDRDYTGVSPAYENNEYDLERNRGMRFETQDYTRGGRFYGDDQRQPIYRQEYGQGGREYGEVPRGYDADREMERRYAREMRHQASGGTGGYDFERGYGDAGRSEDRGGVRDWQRGDDRREQGDRGRSGGGFLQKAKSWLGEAVGEVRRDLAGERGMDRGDGGPQRYSADFNREARWEDPGHRGRGPKGYKRSDERISDDAHQRLTDDPWLDASNINVSVSGGEVTLSGTVENREAKHRAERCVEEISGVTHVQNNLRIEAGGFLTNPGKGYGDSVLEAQMRKDGGDGNVNGGTAAGEDSASTRTTTRRT